MQLGSRLELLGHPRTGREVLLGKEDLPGVLRRTENQPKSAIAPTDGQEMLSSCVLKLLEV